MCLYQQLELGTDTLCSLCRTALILHADLHHLPAAAPNTELLSCQYLYFCTSTASKLSKLRRYSMRICAICPPKLYTLGGTRLRPHTLVA
jgi:hypothetical protein